MAVLDADFCADLTPVEGGDTPCSPPIVAPAREPLDWTSLLEEAEARIEEERGRARVAELRREELRRSERDARALSASLTRRLDTCRFKLKTAATKTASRAMKALQRRVESQDAEISDLRITLRRSHEHQEQAEARHQDEINWLKQDIDRGRSRIARMYREGERVAGSLRKQFDRQLAAARRLVETREGTIAWLRERNERLRAAVVRATTLIASLREKNGRLRAEVRDLTAENAALAERVETLQAQLDRLRSTRSVLSKALYGSRSEQQKKPGTGRKRGQQRGAAGHGRTQRPGLGKKKERRDPPEDARVCPRCGKPYAANGERCTTLFEIDVEAYENTIVRSRWRRSCECASAPREVTAPPVTRLFETTPYGISVWTCMLYERFVCCRPLHRVAAWLADMGLAISPGTLADSIKRFVPLFEPLAEAILAHQNEAALRHADETSWRVQAYREKGRSSRAWLWTSVSPDAVYF
ncbi:MAG: transposase, partial [Alphaproteobacteria bacterium]|nr:transposase [Alphaproteobacteria bacterium]